MWPKLKRDYKGMTVKTVRELKNGSTIIPVGTICIVDDWHKGLTLITPICQHCGIRAFITRVPQSYVEPQ